jgi:hypothetical protein
MAFRFALAAVPVLLAAQQAIGTFQQPGTERPDAASQQPTKPEDKCTVEGQVWNAITGDPLRKAHITLNKVDGGNMRSRNSADYGAASDAGGHFLIQDIEPGTYQMNASRNGFVALSYGASKPDGPSTPLSLNPGRHTRDIVFRLTPNGVITGRVLDEDGEPVQGVSIGAMRFRTMRGKRQLTPFMSNATDDLGEYRLFGLAPGKYYLSATYRKQNIMMAAQDSTPGGAPEEDYTPTYYPGTSDPTGAAPLEVAAGTVLSGVDITLRKGRTVRVRGRVVNTIGEGLPGTIMLRLMPRNMMYAFMSQRMTQAKRSNGGTFEFRGITPGPYVLMAHWNDDGKDFSLRQPIDVGNDSVDNVIVALSPGLAIKGQVRVDGNGEVNLGSLQIALESQAFMMGRTGAQVKENGAFEMENVSADNYRVNVFRLPAAFYVKSIRMGDADGLETGLDLSRGAGGPLEILLSPNGGQVEGTVLDAKQQPASVGTVVLVPDVRHRDQPQLFKVTGLNASGHFTIAGIAPGDYKLFAWQEVEGDAYQDPEFLKPYEVQGQSLTVREGSRENTQLKLIPAEGAPKNSSN